MGRVKLKCRGNSIREGERNKRFKCVLGHSQEIIFYCFFLNFGWGKLVGGDLILQGKGSYESALSEKRERFEVMWNWGQSIGGIVSWP